MISSLRVVVVIGDIASDSTGVWEVLEVFVAVAVEVPVIVVVEVAMARSGPIFTQNLLDDADVHSSLFFYLFIHADSYFFCPYRYSLCIIVLVFASSLSSNSFIFSLSFLRRRFRSSDSRFFTRSFGPGWGAPSVGWIGWVRSCDGYHEVGGRNGGTRELRVEVGYMRMG